MTILTRRKSISRRYLATIRRKSDDSPTIFNNSIRKSTSSSGLCRKNFRSAIKSWPIWRPTFFAGRRSTFGAIRSSNSIGRWRTRRLVWPSTGGKLCRRRRRKPISSKFWSQPSCTRPLRRASGRRTAIRTTAGNFMDEFKDLHHSPNIYAKARGICPFLTTTKK